MKDLQTLIDLQKFGLTHAEILSVPENEREELLAALKDCEEAESSYLSVIETYVKDYRKFNLFEDFLLQKPRFQ